MHKKKIAIVGSGCSGLGALWALKNTPYDVHLYEASERLGGHTSTVTFAHGGKKITVDTGFIVMNTATYPNFIAFLKELNVQTVPTEMTFSVSRDSGAFEWAGTSLNSVFAQRENIFKPRMWRMIFDIVRFNQFALDVLHEEDECEEDPIGTGAPHMSHHKPRSKETVGEYLARNDYSDAFRDDYLIPMTAAVWSTSPEKASLQFPIITLVRFLWNHHLLSTIAARPQWMTIPGGSQQYIDAVMSGFPEECVHRSTQVTSLKNTSDGRVVLSFGAGGNDAFDHVILACHGDQALDIIWGSGTDEEFKVLGGFKTTENTAYLHSDLSLMPKRRLAWTSWNYITTTAPPPPSSTTKTASMDPSKSISSLCLTYNMNILQHLDPSLDVLVTLNPPTPPAPHLTHLVQTYHHPIYNAAAIRSQKLLPRIQGKRGVYYAGAWTKYGFHEDGFSSGLRCAMELGAKLPFEFVDSTFSRGRRPTLTWQDYAVRALISVVQCFIWVLDGLLRFFERRSTKQKLQ